MKTPQFHLLPALAALVLAAVPVGTTFAQTAGFYDPTTVSGNWNTTEAIWGQASGGPYTFNFTNNSTTNANFNGTGTRTITVQENLTLGGLTVREGSNYTFTGTGQTLTFNGNFLSQGNNATGVTTFSNLILTATRGSNTALSAAGTVILNDGASVRFTRTDGFSSLTLYGGNSRASTYVVGAGSSILAIPNNATTSAATLNFGQYNTQTARSMTIDGVVEGGNIVIASPSNTANGATNLTITVNSGGRLTSLAQGGTNGLRIGGTTAITNASALATSVVATINLNGGALEVSSARVLQPVGSTGYNTTINFDAGTLRVVTGANATNRATFFDGFNNARVLAGGARIDTNGQDATMAQALVSGVSGDGGLTKQGAGVLTMTGAHTYEGTTRVDAGTLALSGAGSISSSSAGISIANGAGFSVAAITPGTFSLFGTTTFDLGNVDGSSGLFDAGTKTLAFDGNLTLVLNEAPVVFGDTLTFNLFDFEATGSTGTFSGISLTGTQAGQYSFGSFDYSTGVLTLTAVPEPHYTAIIAGVFLLIVVAARRRQRA